MTAEPTERGATPSIGVDELLSRVDTGQPLLLLDVRNDDEFQRWRLEGRRPVETVHVPYFDFLEDQEASMARLPRDRAIVVVCAQGDSSAMVVDMLQEAGVAAHNLAGGMVRYGEHLEPVQIPLDATEATRGELWQVNRRGKGCLSYVVRSGPEAVVVDASRDVEWYQRFVARLGARIIRVLDTHVHADHLSGGPALAARTGAPYFVNAGEGFELRHPVERLADGQELRVGGRGGMTLVVHVVASPGHTPGSTSYLVGARHLLTGDTLFVRSVGRPDLGGHVVEWGRALHHTLRQRLAAFPDDTVVLPAHFATVDEIGHNGVVAAPLAVLRRTVPELQIGSEEEFVAAMQAAVRPPPQEYAEIIRANLGLTVIDPMKGREWELGKNQCAASSMPAVP